MSPSKIEQLSVLLVSGPPSHQGQQFVCTANTWGSILDKSKLKPGQSLEQALVVICDNQTRLILVCTVRKGMLGLMLS